MTLKEILALDFKQIAADTITENITYAGNVYSVTATDITTSNDLQLDGLEIDVDYTAHIQSADMAIIPKAGEHISRKGKTMKIVKVTETADGAEIILQANNLLKK